MDFLVIDDERSIREAVVMLIDDEGHYAEGTAERASAMTRLKEDKYDAVLLDLNLGPDNGLEVLADINKLYPNLPVIMFTAQGSVKIAVDAMRSGAVDFLEKPFNRDQFRTVVARVTKFRQMGKRIESLEQQVKEVRTQAGMEPRFDFESPLMKDVMDVLMRAAKTPASLLILGESGTGKSVIARAIHEASHLKDKPFVTVSCPSLSKELLQSELFGHVKGSFTGAIKDHWGKVKQAEGGTLFLDEIGELPTEIQPKLLRLLQEREYERLGESTTRTANVRVIAATNRDLKKSVADGAFREDLYFRLNVITVEMPPLRDRPDDLLSFAEYYLNYFAGQCGRKMKGLAENAKSALRHHPWPGNLRELRNAIERAVILCRSDKVDTHDLPPDVRQGENSATATTTATASTTPHKASADQPQPGSTTMTLEMLEEGHIKMVLERSNSLAEAASILGIDQATLYRKRKKIGLE